MRMVIRDFFGIVTASYGQFTMPNAPERAGLYLLEFKGGPIITLTPEQWKALVDTIRGVDDSTRIGA